ncbi:MAG: hypothetical protein EF813_12795 [Methanosarcinales archaeon]|nr:MAG: hypothetical protein EF813_12795 [Methanosarcinales archaeon]
MRSEAIRTLPMACPAAALSITTIALNFATGFVDVDRLLRDFLICSGRLNNMMPILQTVAGYDV